MQDKELKEELANIEHERWSDWQKHCHKVLRENCPSPELEKVLERWDRQIATPYSELSEKEKDSDREQVERYWHLIKEHFISKEEVRKILKNAIAVRDEVNIPSVDYQRLLSSLSNNKEVK